MPLENALNTECSGSEPVGEMKRMVGEAFTSKMVLSFVWFVLFMWLNQITG